MDIVENSNEARFIDSSKYGRTIQLKGDKNVKCVEIVSRKGRRGEGGGRNEGL